MKFFIPSDEFTHYGSFYGFPCWLADLDGECIVAGTNVVWDWCILHLCPWIQWLHETIRRLASGPVDYEPQGWVICIRGELEPISDAEIDKAWDELTGNKPQP